MIVKPDVNLVARLLILQHGFACRDLAEKNADELVAAGDARSLAYWRRVVDAIEQELTPAPNALHH